ncbi:hypothetical protein [Thiomonas sp. X19]|uniref:hypothetical protein n=1 Tax=Thiomonas sp. X19 TaxID=1050370 RepID=UPI001E487F0B|nr:hypothetical protein [Thiomonas sp. X19]
MAVLVPGTLWNASSVAASGTVVCTFAAPAFFPRRPANPAGGDALAIWLIGPISALWVLLLVIAAFALFFSLSGRVHFAWAAGIVWLGVLLAAAASMRGATQIVEVAAGQIRRAELDDRANWVGSLKIAAMRFSSTELESELESLAERVRFASNEKVGITPPENKRITALIDEIRGVPARAPDEVKALIGQVDELLLTREQALQRARSFG